MDAKAKTVREILFSGNQYLIPFFQRSYKWTRKHWERLRADVWALVEDGPTRQHFLGPLVCTLAHAVPGEVPAYQLIDGQQRLTTLAMLLAALRDVARQRGFDDLADKVNENYLVHKQEKDLQRHKVIPRLGDREPYFAVIEEKDARPFGDRGIVQAWEFYRHHIERHAKADGEAPLRRLFAAVTGQLSLVVITIDGENPYEIFESLNSTGLPLEESDLIRNYLFMQVPLPQQEDFDREHWQSFERRFEAADKKWPAVEPTLFYRSYLMREGRYSRDKATFVDFKEQNKARNLSPQDQVAELDRFATYDLQLRRPDRCGDDARRKAFSQIAAMEITTAHPLLLNLMHRRDKGEMDEAMLLGCLDDLAGFVIRRSICGESTRSYARWFCGAAKSIGTSPQEDLRKEWLARGWPDDETFKARLVEFALYRRERSKCRLVLEALEAACHPKERVETRTLTIEHVMPQTVDRGDHGAAWQEMLGKSWQDVHARWLDTLGNLTLTGYNEPMSNRPFKAKKAELAESKLALNRYFAGVAVWDEDAIRRRGERLAEEVVRLWPRPVGGTYVPARSVGIKERRQLRLDYWTAFSSAAGAASFPLKVPEPTTRNWVGIRIGRSGFRLFAYIHLNHHKMGVAFSCRGRMAKANYYRLREQQATIEAAAGEPLVWDEQPGQNASYICIEQNCEPSERRDWPAQHTWLLQKLEELHSVFVPLVKPPPKSGGEAGETKLLQQEYWAGLAKVLLDRQSDVVPQKPPLQHWTNFAVGRSHFSMWAAVDTRKRRLAVGLSCYGSQAKANFHLLEQQKQDIESEIGQTLEWLLLSERKESKIILRLRDADPMEKQDWPRQHLWLAETLERFHKTFTPRVKAVGAEGRHDAEV